MIPSERQTYIKVWWQCGMPEGKCTSERVGLHDEWDAAKLCRELVGSLSMEKKEDKPDGEVKPLRLLRKWEREEHPDPGSAGLDQEECEPGGEGKDSDG